MGNQTGLSFSLLKSTKLAFVEKGFRAGCGSAQGRGWERLTEQHADLQIDFISWITTFPVLPEALERLFQCSQARSDI